MSSPEVPPYQLQQLITDVLDEAIRKPIPPQSHTKLNKDIGISGTNVEIRCAQALGKTWWAWICPYVYTVPRIWIVCWLYQWWTITIRPPTREHQYSMTRNCFIPVINWQQNQVVSYMLLSRQSLPNDKPVDEIVLAPSISRAFILSGN